MRELGLEHVEPEFARLWRVALGRHGTDRLRVRSELGYTTDRSYVMLNRDAGKHWDFGTSPQRQGYAGALGDLQEARAQRPSLRVMIAAGYTDLVTPHAVSRFLIGQLQPDCRGEGQPGAERNAHRSYGGDRRGYHSVAPSLPAPAGSSWVETLPAGKSIFAPPRQRSRTIGVARA